MNRRILIVPSFLIVALLAIIVFVSRRGREPQQPSLVEAQKERRDGAQPFTRTEATKQGPTTVISVLPSRQATMPQSGNSYGEPVAHAGEMARATVKVGSESHELTPNQLGQFSQVYVQARQTVPVVVEYPQAEPGAAVVVQMMDGGQLVAPERPAGIDHDLVRLVRLDERRAARFAVQVSGNEGMHRVVLTKGADQKQLDFWVGQERLAQR